MTDEQILYIFVEVGNGRGNHGSFLRNFAATIQVADPENFDLLREPAEKLIMKYNLIRYLN